MTFQIELVGGPLDGHHCVLDLNDYPPEVVFHVKPELRDIQFGPDDVVPVKRAVYVKRPRKTLAVYYDFDGIH